VSLLRDLNSYRYDFAGSWDSVAGHQANLFRSHDKPVSTPFNIEEAVAYYTTTGQIAPSKIVLGMPIYGRSFHNTDGHGKPYNGVGAPVTPGSWEAGVWDYKALPLAGHTEHFDPSVGASWSYDREQRMMVSYDTKEVACLKARYIVEKGLGGGMWWESSADKKGEQSLICAVRFYSLPLLSHAIHVRK
jgi:chitinase